MQHWCVDKPLSCYTRKVAESSIFPILFCFINDTAGCLSKSFSTAPDEADYVLCCINDLLCFSPPHPPPTLPSTPLWLGWRCPVISGPSQNSFCKWSWHIQQVSRHHERVQVAEVNVAVFTNKEHNKCNTDTDATHPLSVPRVPEVIEF